MYVFTNNRALIALFALPLVALLTLAGLYMDLLPVLTFGTIGLIGAGLFMYVALRANLPVIMPVVVLILMVTPLLRINVPVAGIPAYFLDIFLGLNLAILIFDREQWRPDWQMAAPLPQLVLLIWLPSTVINYFNEAISTGILMETTYTFLRYIVLMSVFYTVICRVRNENALRLVLGAMLLAAGISGAIALTQYLLPPSHPLISVYDALSPRNLRQQAERYLYDYGTIRAHGLVGSGMALGTMLSVSIALGISMVLSEKFQRWRFWLIAGMGISIIGLLATNSRTAYLSIVIVALIHLVQNTKYRVSMAALLALGLVTIYIIVSVTGIINLDFILERIVLTADLDNYANASRLLVFERMMDFLQSDIKHILIGNGDSTQDLLARGLIPFDPNIPNGLHNTFIMIVINRGLISGMIFAGAIGSALMLLFQHIAPENPYLWLVQGMKAAILGMMPLLLFDHSVISTPGYQAFIYLMLGLTVVTYRLAHTAASSAEAERLPTAWQHKFSNPQGL